MKTEHLLAAALKETMCKVSLDDISVLTLTKKCHINRQTFYYHFHDIYDLLTQVFLDEKIEGIGLVQTFDDLITTIYKYYETNVNFIDAVINSAGRDLFQEFIYNNMYQTILKIINNDPISIDTQINDKKSIARFYGLGFAYSIVYYLSNYKNRSLQGLKKSFAFLDNSFLSKALKNANSVGK